MAYKRILAATDFSETGDLAVQRASGLARDTGAALVVAHVLPPAPAPSPLYAHYYEAKGPQLVEAQEAARSALTDLVKGVAGSNAKMNVSYEVVIGDAVEQLCELIKKSSPDLVVVASSGRTAFSRWILGSVTDKLVRTCEQDVLVVRHGEN